MASSISQLFRFSKKELSVLFKKARRVLTHPGLHILVAPSTRDVGRLLVVTGRKVGNAPTRNKIRRRFKAIFYEQLLFKLKIDCIVIMKPAGANSSYEDLKQFLVSTLTAYAAKKDRQSDRNNN